MENHARDRHGGVMSSDPLKDYEFARTGSFQKPLHRKVDANLRITRAERVKIVRVGMDMWQVSLPLLSWKHNFWAQRNMSFNFSYYNR